MCDANRTTLEELLTQRIGNYLQQKNIFQVAHYQRPYCWPVDYVIRLIRDLWQAHLTGKQHFIGCVITCSRPKVRLLEDGELAADNGDGAVPNSSQDWFNHRDITDGQQRLITITLIIRAVIFWMRKYCQPPPSGAGGHMERRWSTIRDYFADCTNLMRTSHKKQFVHIMRLSSQETTDWFHKNILTNDDELLARLLASGEGAIPVWQRFYVNTLITALAFFATKVGPDKFRKAFDERVTQAQVSQVYREFREGGEFRLQDFDDMDNFLESIKTTTIMVHFYVNNQKEAVEIFNTLNESGLRLTAPQRIKATLFLVFDHNVLDAELAEALGTTWNDREALLQELFLDSTDEHLTPYLRCLCEITPKAADNFANVACPQVFRKCAGNSLLEDVKEIVLETRDADDPLKITQREMLFEKDRPKEKAVVLFFQEYLHYDPVRIFCSLIDVNDDSWARPSASLEQHPPFLKTLGPEHNKVRANVQNVVTLFKHLYHMRLDQDFVNPVMLFARVWGLADGPHTKCPPECVEQFFLHLECFAAYCLLVKPMDAQRQRDGKVERRQELVRDRLQQSSREEWLQHEELCETRRGYYRELMHVIQTKPPEEVSQWLKLGAEEVKALQSELQEPTCGSFPAVKSRTTVYMLLRAEMQLSDDPIELHAMWRSVLPRSLHQADRHHLAGERYNTLSLEHILPRGNVRAESDWRKDQELGGFGWRTHDMNEYRESLGNFTLLTPKENSDAGNGDFKFKVKLFEANRLGRFAITHGLLGSSFRVEDLTRRETILKETLACAWRVATRSQEEQHAQVRKALGARAVFNAAGPVKELPVVSADELAFGAELPSVDVLGSLVQPSIFAPPRPHQGEGHAEPPNKKARPSDPMRYDGNILWVKVGGQLPQRNPRYGNQWSYFGRVQYMDAEGYNREAFFHTNDFDVDSWRSVRRYPLQRNNRLSFELAPGSPCMKAVKVQRLVASYGWKG